MEPFPIITTEELERKIDAGEKLNLIDVREDEEVAFGMIAGAKHIRMGEIPEHLDDFDKDKEYIIICRSSRRSANVCYYMQEQGYQVCNLVGGMLEWKGEVVL